MSEKKWIGFLDSSEVNAAPAIKVEKSADRLDSDERAAVTVRYTTSGAWESTVDDFRKIEVPETTLVEAEGAPAVPKDGIFVAVPMDAEDVQVRLISKAQVPVDHEVLLAPAPKQFVEGEFREVREPDPAIYGSDAAYPGHDFDFLGLKTISGVRVAHIQVYLGQYQPVSKKMELVQSLVLEVSYRTQTGTDGTDSSPARRFREELPEADMILGLDLVEGPAGIAFDAAEMDMEEGGAALPSDMNFFGISGRSDAESDPLLQPQPASGSELISGWWLRPKLKWAGCASKYVIITSRALARSVAPLLAAKSGSPLYAKTALLEDIKAEFPAADLKESIKSFIAWAVKHWRIPPRFIVLAGDTDIIPMQMYFQTHKFGPYASDHYYVDLADDLAPELIVSRIPTSDAAQMLAVCKHLASYAGRRKADWGWWQNRVMLCAYQESTYETACDQVAEKFDRRFSVIKRYARDTVKADVVKTMNEGVLLAVYRGHGSKTRWKSSNGLDSADAAGLANGSQPPFVLNICCENGWVDDNSLETIAETFIRRNKSVAVLASSRDSWTYPNNDFANYLADAVMTGRCRTPGEIVSYAKTKMVKNHSMSDDHKDNTVMYNLFGDPAADVISNAEWLRGDWKMDHDGWKGTLTVNRIWKYRLEKSADGKHVAPVWSISGSYLSSDGKKYPFTGTLGTAADPEQTGSKRSDHKIDFRIEFSPANRQRFIGYIHTWTLNRVSGLTWWAGHPFGWTAEKMR